MLHRARGIADFNTVSDPFSIIVIRPLFKIKLTCAALTNHSFLSIKTINGQAKVAAGNANHKCDK